MDFMKVTDEKKLILFINFALRIEYCIDITDSFKEVDSAIKAILNVAINDLR